LKNIGILKEKIIFTLIFYCTAYTTSKKYNILNEIGLTIEIVYLYQFNEWNEKAPG